MTRLLIQAQILFFSFILTIACYSGSTENGAQFREEANVRNSVSLKASSTKHLCSVDFRNFRFPPAFDELGEFTLKDGSVSAERDVKGGISGIGYELNGVFYDDVTGDGRVDAAVVIDVITGGSSVPKVLYVFSSKNDEVKLLWKMNFGDRADGGLKTLYTRDAFFVIESYQGSRTDGDCCPSNYLVTIYKWDGKTFKKMKSEKHVNPDDGAIFSLKASSCG